LRAMVTQFISFVSSIVLFACRYSLGSSSAAPRYLSQCILPLEVLL
jgi:hypothetical protein